MNHFIAKLAQPTKPTTLAFVNAHAMNLVATSQTFTNSLLQADALVRDGTGMAQLLKLLGKNPGENLNGTDLIPTIITLFDGKKIALLGTQEPVLKAARNKIMSELAPKSDISLLHGFCQATDYLAFCIETKPDLIVLGMGMPKQEHVAALLREQLSEPCSIVCGGAIIDFLGGRVQRAPGWVRRCGIEWIYRLLIEPRRLFKRYVIGNPLFLLRAKKYTKLTSSLTS